MLKHFCRASCYVHSLLFWETLQLFHKGKVQRGNPFHPTNILSIRWDKAGWVGTHSFCRGAWSAFLAMTSGLAPSIPLFPLLERYCLSLQISTKAQDSLAASGVWQQGGLGAITLAAFAQPSCSCISHLPKQRLGLHFMLGWYFQGRISVFNGHYSPHTISLFRSSK